MAETAILTYPNEAIIIKIDGSQGPPGPPGADGEGSTKQYTASTALSGDRAVVFTSSTSVGYADNTNASHKNLYAGITTGAVSSGGTATVQRHGSITSGSWSWTVNSPIFFTTSGTLTQTVPTTGSFIQIIGVAISATSIFLAPREPISII